MVISGDAPPAARCRLRARRPPPGAQMVRSGVVTRRTTASAFVALLAALVVPVPAHSAGGVVWESGGSAIVDPALRHASGAVHVIVSATAGGLAEVSRQVHAAQGTVRATLPIADAVAATMPASQV